MRKTCTAADFLQKHVTYQSSLTRTSQNFQETGEKYHQYNPHRAIYHNGCGGIIHFHSILITLASRKYPTCLQNSNNMQCRTSSSESSGAYSDADYCTASASSASMSANIHCSREVQKNKIEKSRVCDVQKSNHLMVKLHIPKYR